MTSVGIVALLVPLLALVLAAGWLVVHYSAPLVRADLKRLYLYAVSFIALTLAAAALIMAVQDATRILLGVDPVLGGLRPERPGQTWDLSWRESIAGWLGQFFMAAPVWVWHFRQAVKRSAARQAWTVHRLYLYAVAVLFLVVGIGFVAAMAAQGLRVILGVVDVSNPAAVRELWQGVVRGFLDGGICAALWWTHYRAIPQPTAGQQAPAV